MSTSYETMLQQGAASSTATILIQLVFILVVTRVLAKILGYLKQPPVIGEIIGGIIMGPTVLCRIPAFKAFMFPAQYMVALKGLSDLGVVFFMFVLGLEFDPVLILRSVRKTWVIALSSIILPFGLGCAIASYMYDQTDTATTNPNTNFIPFLLFTAACMSFTAFPVLARILTANNALTAQIGLVAMSVSALDDVLAWTVLAIATSYQTGGRPENGAWGVLISIAWVIFLLTVGRKIHHVLRDHLPENVYIACVFIGMCFSAWLTQVLGLHAFFGGFIFGVSVPKTDKAWSARFIHNLEVIVVNFFVPVFFCNSGLSTDLNTLSSSAGPVCLVIFLATAGKMLPAFLLGKFFRKYSWAFSFQLASLMNARGLVELIALSIAQSSGAFNVKMYSIYVVMALTTTFMSGPMFYFSYDPKKDPAIVHEPEIQSEEQPVEPPQPAICVEIPKDEQLPKSDAAPYTGYIFYGTVREEKQTPRGTIAGKIWSEPVSRTSTTTTSASSVSDGSHQRAEDAIPEEPEASSKPSESKDDRGQGAEQGVALTVVQKPEECNAEKPLIGGAT